MSLVRLASRKLLATGCSLKPRIGKYATAGNGGIATSSFSTNDKGDNKNSEWYNSLKHLEDANPERIHEIKLHPESVGKDVLPGNLVYKKYRWSGNTRKIPMEFQHGYFWMMWDLRRTENKPTLSNDAVIPEEKAQLFPVLKGLKLLTGQAADLPFHVMDQDGGPKCTLVAISFRDYGYKHLETWTKPFKLAFEGNPRADAIKVSVTERWSLYPLQGFLANVMKRNTPPEEHSKTLTYFGTNIMEFRDVLRIHNIMTGYIFLVDELGRVRFAGSGPASEEDVAKIIQFGSTLMSSTNDQSGRTKRNTERRWNRRTNRARPKQRLR